MANGKPRKKSDDEADSKDKKAGASAEGPVQGGTEAPKPARAVRPGESTKAELRTTRSIEDPTTRERMRESLEQRIMRAGVVKTPEFEVPQAATRAAPAPPLRLVTPSAASAGAVTSSQAATLKPPVGPAPVATPTSGASPGAVKAVELPEWFKPPPDDLYPMTADDVPIDFYPIKEPYAYVLVTHNTHDRETVYRVIEPPLSVEETKILDFVETTMVDMLQADPDELEGKTHEEYLKTNFDQVLYDYSIVLGQEEEQEKRTKEKLLYYLFRDFIGEARIDVMTRDDLIEDISCDGAHQPVFLYHRRHESVKSNVKFANDKELDSFVIRMAQRAGKHISIAEPILDATMRDGSRIQATLSTEVSAKGSTFTIRKFRSEPFTPPDLVRLGTMSAEILAFWWIAIQHGASAIYAGGTASGKTTSLNAILLFIPPQMKIVSIEDTRELSLPHPNWIPGITRSGFGPRDSEGRQTGEIDMFQLLRNALRQRPEYIIVGEVRGKEAYNLFQAMATGHAAYGTMHADSVDAVIHRLESDPINIPRSLLEALDIVSIQIQTRVGGKRVRRTKALAEIVGVDPHTREILTNEVFRWQPKDDSFRYSGVSYVLEKIQAEKGLSPDQMKLELENRVEIIKYMIAKNVRNYIDVARFVSNYYKDPAGTMERVRKGTL